MLARVGGEVRVVAGSGHRLSKAKDPPSMPVRLLSGAMIAFAVNGQGRLYPVLKPCIMFLVVVRLRINAAMLFLASISACGEVDTKDMWL